MRSSSAGVTEPFWVAPGAIEFKISPFLDLHGVRGDDWDLERRYLFANCAKAKAIRARFVDDTPWMETELFADAYKRRLERDGRIGRFRNLADLANDYERRFGKLYEALKRDGFRTEAASGKKLSLPAFLIGRDGQVFIGNQGNHRLAMAQVLGLEKIAGRIVCRHPLWTG
jgi:hypothetical protein